MAAIKANYRRMLARWHPDQRTAHQEEAAAMTRKIIAAYQTIMDYCLHYQYSFTKDTIHQSPSPEEWWFEHFGDDPSWGKRSKS